MGTFLIFFLKNKKAPKKFAFFLFVVIITNEVYFLQTPTMKNHSREFSDILDSNSIQRKIQTIKDNADRDLCKVLSLSNKDFEELRKILNKNKFKA